MAAALDPLLHIEVERHAGTLRVLLSGEIDRSVSPELRETLHRLVQDPAVRQIVVDLRGISFLDAAGLAAIVDADAAYRRAGLRLTVVRARPHVHRLFVLTNVHRQLVMVDEPGEVRAAGPRNGR